jgi:hypothetical protein
MVLPRKVAKETRTQFAGIIQRYMAGDQSLIADSEIQSKADSESSAPLAELARASLDESTEHQLTRKRKLEQLELEERTVELELRRADAQTKHVANITANCTLYTDLCPNQIIDERGRVLIKDCILNAITNQLYVLGPVQCPALRPAPLTGPRPSPPHPPLTSASAASAAVAKASPSSAPRPSASSVRTATTVRKAWSPSTPSAASSESPGDHPRAAAPAAVAFANTPSTLPCQPVLS